MRVWGGQVQREIYTGTADRLYGVYTGQTPSMDRQGRTAPWTTEELKRIAAGSDKSQAEHICTARFVLNQRTGNRSDANSISKDPGQPAIGGTDTSGQNGSLLPLLSPGVTGAAGAAAAPLMLFSMIAEDTRRGQQATINANASEKTLKQLSDELIARTETAVKQMGSAPNSKENLLTSETQSTGATRNSECNCEVKIGQCKATLRVLRIERKKLPTGTSNSRADYEVRSNNSCSMVDYYIDNTPYTTVFNDNKLISVESTWGTGNIDRSTFKIKSCQLCERKTGDKKQ